MKIRNARKQDWNSIVSLIGLHPDKLMQDHLPSWREFVVAVENGRILGCCALEVYTKRGHKSPRLAEVRSLVVDPKHRRQCIGGALVVRCLSKATGLKVYEVIAITGQVGLFQKLGFRYFYKEKSAMLKIL